MTRENWDDLRFLLAVAEAGSVNGAARALGVNHATVLRRIAAYEAATGIVVFDKTARGYSVPADRRAIVQAAREVDSAVQALHRVLRGNLAPVSGEVTVTTTDSLAQVVLPPVIAELRAVAPDLRIDVISTNAHLDLGRTEADIAVRAAKALAEGLEGEAVARLCFRVYRRRDAVDGGAWLGLAGATGAAPVARWLAEAAGEAAVTARADSFLVLRELVAQGMGRAVLPAYVGDTDPRLEPVPGIEVPDLAGIWVASHADLARVPRIARVRRLMSAAIAARRDLIEGRLTAGGSAG
ncbi:MAG: LysR family transcriptional regulator [Rhodobacteraceae bacterium]|nr:LysR family transcriptional regulator [Paracoccaceae bacterium]